MSPIRMSKVESAIRIVLEFNEAFNRHDMAGMMQLMSEDCVFENMHPAPDGTVYSGKEAITQFWQDFFREVTSCSHQDRGCFWFGSTVRNALEIRMGRRGRGKGSRPGSRYLRGE